MDLARPRWTTADDFLSDLPTRHCTTKPRHTFCTICYRINHDVAFDCPLREAQEIRAPEPARPHAPALPYAAAGAPRFQAPGPWPPPPPPEMPEGPVIEFSRGGEVPPKRRVKARPSETRGPPPPATPPALPPPAPLAPEPTVADLEAELKSWDPESPSAPFGFQPAPIVQDLRRRVAAGEGKKERGPPEEPGGAAPPAPPSDAPPTESEKVRPHRRPRA